MLRVHAANTVLPGRCFICERAFEDGEAATFTQFTYSPDWDSKLYGNKMVCDNCTAALAEINEYQSAAKVAESLNEVAEMAEVTRVNLEARIAELEAAEPVSAKDIAAEVAKLMKPKPRPRSANAESTA